jgi:hypothetical protein
MQSKRYQISTEAQNYNIVYVEGMSENLALNNNKPNEFNDVRMVIEIVKSVPTIVGKWEGTTEPGTHFTLNPMNPNGAARIAFGQYKSWQVGTHFGSGSDPHEALVQVQDVSVFRDKNKDMIKCVKNSILLYYLFRFNYVICPLNHTPRRFFLKLIRFGNFIRPHWAS